MNLTTKNILDFLEEEGEDLLKSILVTFSCPVNPEIEKFLKERAIDFAKRRLSITYLVTDKDEIRRICELRRRRREHEQYKAIAPLNAPNISAVDAISGVLAGKVSDDIDRHSLREMRLSRYALDD